MKNPKECTCIEEVRAAIDAIDQEVIALLGKRFQYVKEVVQYKKKDKDSIVAIERYNAVLEERRRLALTHGLSPDIIEQMYRLLMDYFIEQELKIIDKA